MRRLILFLFFTVVFTTYAQETDIPPRPIITPENAHDLTQIAQLGRGAILDIAFSEDENALLVASPIGIWEYDMADLSAPPEWIQIYLYGQSDYLSPNGQYLIIKNPVAGFKVYDIGQKEVVSGSEGIDFTNVIFSPQSDKLAYMTSNQINVWDIATSRISLTLPVPNNVAMVHHIRFSPDGKSLATVFHPEDTNSPNELWIWDIDTGLEIRHFYISLTSDIEWSPDGETFLIGDGDVIGGQDVNFSNSVHARLISATTGLERQVFSSQRGPVLGGDLTFSPDGQYVALASDGTIVYGSAPYNPSGIIYIWDVEFSEPMVILSGHVQRLRQAIFSPTARYVAGAGRDGMLRIWDARNGEEIAHIRDHALNWGYSLNSTIGMIAVGDTETAIHLWDTETFTEQVILHANEGEGNMIFAQFSPDGRYLVSFHHMERPMSVLDTQTWEVYNTYSDWQFRNPIFHPILPVLAFRNSSYGYTIWNYETDDVLDWAAIKAISITFPPHADWLIYDNFINRFEQYSQDLVVLDLVMNDVMAILHHPYPITQRQLSSDGHYLAVTINRGDETWIWDTTTWTVRYILNGDVMGFSPDTRWIAIRPNLHTLNFYDVQSGEFRYTLTTRPDSDMSAPVFSPDSYLMITATNNGVIRIHHADTGEIITTIEALPLAGLHGFANFPDIQWSADGQLIMVSHGGIARVFAILN